VKLSIDVPDDITYTQAFFKLSDMAAIGPLTMARDNVLRYQMNQNLLAADLGDIGELWAFQITCISLINGGHVTLSGNVTLRIVTTMLGILEGKIRTVSLLVTNYLLGPYIREEPGR